MKKGKLPITAVAGYDYENQQNNIQDLTDMVTLTHKYFNIYNSVAITIF
jgi:hypothetical protein